MPSVTTIVQSLRSRQYPIIQITFVDDKWFEKFYTICPDDKGEIQVFNVSCVVTEKNNGEVCNTLTLNIGISIDKVCPLTYDRILSGCLNFFSKELILTPSYHVSNFLQPDPLPGGGDGEGDFGGVEGREGRLFTKFLLLFEAFAFGAEVREEVGGGAVGAVLGDKFAPDGGLKEGCAELCGCHGRRPWSLAGV